jgi:tetratricopeptide (TPR) repeat protein
MYLLQGDTYSAQQAAGDKLLEPISIPYARYTIFLSLANIELALARRDHSLALTLVEDLLVEVLPLTEVDLPEVLRSKARALHGLGRIKEAVQILEKARSLAEKVGCNLHLWPVLADLARAHSNLGNHREAQANREAARAIVERIALSLDTIGLHDSFLNQPRVQKLLRE